MIKRFFFSSALADEGMQSHHSFRCPNQKNKERPTCPKPNSQCVELSACLQPIPHSSNPLLEHLSHFLLLDFIKR